MIALKHVDKLMDANISYMARTGRMENAIGRKPMMKTVLKDGKKMITISMNLRVKI